MRQMGANEGRGFVYFGPPGVQGTPAAQRW